MSQSSRERSARVRAEARRDAARPRRLCRAAAPTPGGALAALLVCSLALAPAPARAGDEGPVDIATDALCPRFAEGVVTGVVEDRSVRELSGLAASRRNAGVLWVINDGENAAVVTALSPEGRRLGRYLLPVRNRDWEGLAIGPGPEAGVDYLYVGDIGDNRRRHRSIVVHRFAEPELATQGDTGRYDRVAGATALEMRYPDGALNAETLLVDPLDAGLYVVTKSGRGPTRVFRRPAAATSAPAELAEVAQLLLPGNSLERLVTGGDISPDGSEIILRTYTHAYLFRRASGRTVAEALSTEPCAVPMAVEPQGEAVAWTSDGLAYVTVSEGRGQPIHRYDRQPLGSAAQAPHGSPGQAAGSVR